MTNTDRFPEVSRSLRYPPLVVLLIASSLLSTSVSASAVSLTPSGATPYGACFRQSANNHNVSMTLLQAVAATESGWNPNARSHANAHGLMQIQWPGTARHLGVRRLAQLYSPCKNIDLGARYLRELLNKYADDERRALAAYNYGPGRIKSSGAIPEGAQRYVDTVARHQRILSGQRVKPRAKSRAAPALLERSQRVAEFSSRQRAHRYVRLLQQRVSGATFVIAEGSRQRYRIVMKPGDRPLNADERTVLQSLGWTGKS